MLVLVTPGAALPAVVPVEPQPTTPPPSAIVMPSDPSHRMRGFDTSLSF
jgi:hypothetical protein